MPAEPLPPPGKIRLFSELTIAEQQSLISLISEAVDHRFEKSGFLARLQQLGASITGEKFEDYLHRVSGLKFELEKQTHYYAEVCTLLRASHFPNLALTHLLLNLSGIKEGEPLYLAALGAAALASEDVLLPYHNAIHANNFSFLAVSAARMEGLSPDDQALLLITGQSHDLRHTGLTIHHPERHALEIRALKVLGLERKSSEAEWVARPNSPAALLKPKEQIKIAGFILDTFSGKEDALQIKHDYFTAHKKGAVPQELTERAIVIESDLGESVSRAGNRVSSQACYDETVATQKKLGHPLTAKELEQVKALYFGDMQGFVETWAPQTDAFAKMGLKDESQKLIRELGTHFH